MPVKKHISALKKQVERIDGAVAKLDKVCAGLDTGKDKEKKAGCPSRKKLSQMKVISEQQKKEPEKPKTKESGSKFIRFLWKRAGSNLSAFFLFL